MSDPARHRFAFAASAALLVLLGGYSLSLAQQTAGTDEESLAIKEYDPTASLTQFKIQDIYTPAEYGTNAQPSTLQIRPLLAVRPQLFTPLEQLIRPRRDRGDPERRADLAPQFPLILGPYRCLRAVACRDLIDCGAKI